jgi:hypothetical protein
MKKIITVGLTIMMSITALALTVIAEDDKPPIKAPFEAFTIQYLVDTGNHDTERDNVPSVEYDPDNGWKFYRVELDPGKDPDGYNKYRLVLDNNGKRIPINLRNDRDIHQQLNMIFDDKVSFQANADFAVDNFTINHYCHPQQEGECGSHSLAYTKSIKFSKEEAGQYYKGGVFAVSCHENVGKTFNPRIGTIQIFDENLQFEQWDLHYSGYQLSKREALNPALLPSEHDILGLGSIRGYLLDFESNINMTTMNKSVIEFFIEKDTFTFNGIEHEFITMKDRCPNVPSYNCCRRYKDEIIIPLKTFAELMGFKYSSFDPKTNKHNNECHSIEIPYHIQGENQIITFREGSNIMEFRYGKDIELPIEAFEIPDDPDIVIGGKAVCGHFDFHIPLLPLLDLLPRYNNSKGYKTRPMNDSILISTHLRNR